MSWSAKRKRDGIEAKIQGDPKRLLSATPFFSGLPPDKLPIIFHRTGESAYSATLAMNIRHRVLVANGASRTQKEAARLCAIDACQQLNALGLLKDAKSSPDSMYANPKTYLTKSASFSAICTNGNAKLLPFVVRPEVHRGLTTFVVELPCPLREGKVWVAVGRGRNKVDAEKACCIAAVTRLQAEGLLERNARNDETMARAEQMNDTPPVVTLRDADLARIEQVLRLARSEFPDINPNYLPGGNMGEPSSSLERGRDSRGHEQSYSMRDPHGDQRDRKHEGSGGGYGTRGVVYDREHTYDGREGSRRDDAGHGGRTEWRSEHRGERGEHGSQGQDPQRLVHHSHSMQAAESSAKTLGTPWRADPLLPGLPSQGNHMLSANGGALLSNPRSHDALNNSSSLTQLLAAHTQAGLAGQGSQAKGEEDPLKRQTWVPGTKIEPPPQGSAGAGLVGRAEDNEMLRQQASKRLQHPDYAKQRACRQKLPAWKYKEQVLAAVAQSQVVVLTGETGCGKTTQVPQFLLEDAEEKGVGSQMHIIITQPRRIAAISVAERVAWERKEPLGQSVGYAIRLENRPPRPFGSLLFCTTGILLRRLQRPDGIEGVSHIVIDEVHERDVDTDFLLVVVRELLQHRSQLRVIIMSATLNAATFTGYFGGCPLVSIPGFTHPVQEYYLEDFPRLMGATCPPPVRAAKIPRPGSPEEEEIDFPLTTAVISWVCQHFAKDDGAVLCFLPGWDAIQRVQRELQRSGAASGKLLIVPLHSQLPSGEQRTAFSRPPAGMRKVVLSTNIAETSVTIDDVVYVIDCGRSKEKNYEPARDLATMRVQWVSQASAKQRQGRAGRVRPGFCFRLFSRQIHTSMIPHVVPEMQRVPLEELSLSIKAIATQGLAVTMRGLQGGNPTKVHQGSSVGMSDIATFLSKALQPPAISAIQTAIQNLKQMGALDACENLTALGRTLGKLGVHPRLGKMLVYGALLGCLQPLLTIAAATCSRDPFLAPAAKRNEADQARLGFAKESAVGSDQLCLARAYDAWVKVSRTGQGSSFCDANFLSIPALRLIAGMREQFERTLLQLRLSEPSTAIADSEQAARVARSVIGAGLYPNIARSRIQFKSQNSKPALGFTVHGRRVAIHPSSVINEKDLNPNGSYFVAFHEKVQISQVWIRSCTLLPHFAVTLLAGSLRPAAQQSAAKIQLPGDWTILAVDRDLQFAVDRRAAGLLLEFRRVLDEVLARWVDGKPRTGVQREVVKCAVHLLASTCQEAVAG